jgi:hypothetical protein
MVEGKDRRQAHETPLPQWCLICTAVSSNSRETSIKSIIPSHHSLIYELLCNLSVKVPPCQNSFIWNCVMCDAKCYAECVLILWSLVKFPLNPWKIWFLKDQSLLRFWVGSYRVDNFCSFLKLFLKVIYIYVFHRLLKKEVMLPKVFFLISRQFRELQKKIQNKNFKILFPRIQEKLWFIQCS